MKTGKISLNKLDIWRVLEISVELEQPQDKSPPQKKPKKKNKENFFLKVKKERYGMGDALA